MSETVENKNENDRIIKLKKDVAKYYNSAEFNKLNATFQKTDILKIIGVSRKEERHSRFIAWLLDPEESHGLGYFPLERFLQLLAVSKNEHMNNLSEFPDELETLFLMGNYTFDKSHPIEVYTEYTINARMKPGKKSKKDNNNYLDILIKDVSINNEKIFILIENKVKSGEGDGQTVHYYDWAHGNLEDESNDLPNGKPICVFLYPSILHTECQCEKFIKITYQDIADMVLYPCLLKTKSDRTKFYLTEYLNTLSYSKEDSKGGLVMAYSQEERNLCEAFFEENRELLSYVVEVLRSADYDDEDLDSVSSVVKQQGSSRDRTKYSFNGEGEYNKRRLALKIFQEASKQHSTLDDIKKLFKPINDRYRDRLLILASDLDSEGIDETRYFSKMDEQIRLGDNSYCLSNQWGKGVDFDELLRIAKTKLKYDITEL